MSEHGSAATNGGSTSTTRTERERPLHELLSRDMVDLYIGPENTHWVLHEKLLCYRSRFFRDIFYNKKGSKNHTYGLPDDDDAAFKLFVGWLYSESVAAPSEEKQLGPLFDLYLMGERWEIRALVLAVLDAVRRWYHDSATWPSLRRVQYVYANTAVESPLRQLLVACVARMLVVGKQGMPPHWENALRKNGQLAVDVILCVQKWKVSEDDVPDARDESVKPFVEEAEHKVEIKKEKEEEEHGKANGVHGGDADHDGTNGVNGHHGE